MGKDKCIKAFRKSYNNHILEANFTKNPSKKISKICNHAYHLVEKSFGLKEKMENIIGHKLSEEECDALFNVCKSKMNSNKASTGQIYQCGFETLLKFYSYHYESQYDSDKKVDFVVFNKNKELVALCSVKYNLRERWKQAIHEKIDNVPLFLIVFGKRDWSKDNLMKMKECGMQLVHPNPIEKEVMHLDYFMQIELPRLIGEKNNEVN